MSIIQQKKSRESGTEGHGRLFETPPAGINEGFLLVMEKVFTDITYRVQMRFCRKCEVTRLCYAGHVKLYMSLRTHFPGFTLSNYVRLQVNITETCPKDVVGLNAGYWWATRSWYRSTAKEDLADLVDEEGRRLARQRASSAPGGMLHNSTSAGSSAGQPTSGSGSSSSNNNTVATKTTASSKMLMPPQPRPPSNAGLPQTPPTPSVLPSGAPPAEATPPPTPSVQPHGAPPVEATPLPIAQPQDAPVPPVVYPARRRRLPSWVPSDLVEGGQQSLMRIDRLSSSGVARKPKKCDAWQINSFYAKDCLVGPMIKELDALEVEIVEGVGRTLHEIISETADGTRNPDFVITCSDRADEKHRAVPATHYKCVVYMVTIDGDDTYEYLLLRKEPEVVEGWCAEGSTSPIHTVLFGYRFHKGWLVKKAKAERAGLPAITSIIDPVMSLFTFDVWTEDLKTPEGCYSLRGLVCGRDCVLHIREWAMEFFEGMQRLERNGVKFILASTLLPCDVLKACLSLMLRDGRFPFLTSERLSTMSYPNCHSTGRKIAIKADISDFMPFAMYGSAQELKDMQKRVLILPMLMEHWDKRCHEMAVPMFTKSSKIVTSAADQGGSVGSRYLLVISKFVQLKLKDPRYDPDLPPVWTALRWATDLGLMETHFETGKLCTLVWKGAKSGLKLKGHQRSIGQLMEFYLTRTVFKGTKIQDLMAKVSKMVSGGKH